jgi:hypothetical protein
LEESFAKMKTSLVETLISVSTAGELLTLIDKAEIAIIERRGTFDGRNAAEWFTMRTNDAYINRLIRGIEEGDSMILDQLPQPRLNGEFADDPTWEAVLKSEGVRLDTSVDDDGRQELLQVYEEAFGTAVTGHIVTLAPVIE